MQRCQVCQRSFYGGDHESTCWSCVQRKDIRQQATLDATMGIAQNTTTMVALLKEMEHRFDKQDARMLKMEQFIVATHDQLQLLVDVSKGTLLDESAVKE
jgi:hypothetical protein